MPRREEPEGHPTQNPANPFPADQRLRAFGYSIASRPRKGEAVWTLNGRRVPQRLALELIDRAIADVER